MAWCTQTVSTGWATGRHPTAAGKKRPFSFCLSSSATRVNQDRHQTALLKFRSNQKRRRVSIACSDGNDPDLYNNAYIVYALKRGVEIIRAIGDETIAPYAGT